MKIKLIAAVFSALLFLFFVNFFYKTIIDGNKTLTGKTVLTDGMISPGNSPGKITIIGDFTMQNTGIYRCELKNLNGAGIGHDQIDVSGNVILDGTLDIVLLNGYTPQNTHLFEIMKFGGTLTGSFSAINGLPTDWQIDYGAIEPHSVIIYGPNAVDIPDNGFGNEQFTFYPNPATNMIIFQQPVEIVTIYDLTGKEVLTRKHIDAVLDLSEINAGVYLLDVNHGAYKQRLVISK